MTVVIGAKPESGFQDPIGLLTDCHRRIEGFLSVLLRVGLEARGGALTPQQRDGLETALGYFRLSAPRHTADEEESLFPRLRSLDRPEIRDVLARIETLEQDHDRADAGHAEIERLGRKWLDSGSLAPGDAARFSKVLGELAALYKQHIAVEESELFPVAANVLDSADREAVGNEMAERRGLRH